MKVFISWSGESSRRAAEALRDWLPKVIQAVKPWVSASDIEKGARWETDIARELRETKVGILCLTPDNLSAPWLLFEAGALSKTLDKTYVCPYLLGVGVAQLQGPLVQFQAAQANEADTLRLTQTINRAQEDNALKEDIVADSFRVRWPELQPRLADATAAAAQAQPAPVRTDRSIIEEILDLARAAGRDAAERERRERLTRDIGRALGAFDTNLASTAIGRLPVSQIEQAFFEVDKAGKLELVMRKLAEERERAKRPAKPGAKPAPVEPPPEAANEPPPKDPNKK